MRERQSRSSSFYAVVRFPHRSDNGLIRSVLGTALKILFSANPIQLQRSELVSLINGFTQLAMSIYRLEHTFKTCLQTSPVS